MRHAGHVTALTGPRPRRGLIVAALIGAVVVSWSPRSHGTSDGVQANLVLRSDSPTNMAHGRFTEFEGYLSRSARPLKSGPFGSESFAFIADLPAGGIYQVYAWWPHAEDASRDVTYTIHDSRGSITVEADQSIYAGQWNHLGSYRFEDRVVVELTAPPGASFMVDALRVMQLDEQGRLLRFVTDALPFGEVGEPYTARLEVVGGLSPYHWDIRGALPSGLTFHPPTRTISGIPHSPGRRTIKVQVSDAAGHTILEEFTIDVGPRPRVPAPARRSAVRSTLCASDDFEVILTASILPAPGSIAGVLPERGVAARKQRPAERPATCGNDNDFDVILTAGGATPAESGPDLSGLLAILAALPEGDWARVNLNSFSEVWTPAELRPLKGAATNPKPSKIISAWSSFAWDANRGDLLIYGGGHANYSGNDIYRWRGSTRRWERASLPSEIMQDDLGNWTAIDGPDAAPPSAHTYDNNVFLPGLDRMLVLGGAAYNNGGGFLRQVDETTSRRTGPYLFDPGKADPNMVGGTTGSHVQRVAPYPEIVGGNMWQNRDIYVNIPGDPPLLSNHVRGVTAYAREEGRDVVYIGANAGGTPLNLYRYVIHDVDDPTSDTWEQVGRFWNASVRQGAGAHDPARRVFLRTGKDTTIQFLYWDLSTPGPGNRDVIMVPEDPGGEFLAAIAAKDITNYGMDYDPIRDRFVLWGGGPVVWNLTPPTSLAPTGWVIEKQPPPSGPVPAEFVFNGVLGKWKYIPALGAFIALEDPVDGNVWIYKPVGWRMAPGDEAPSVWLTAPADGDVFTTGDSISLAAVATDPDGHLVRVEFYADDTLLGEATTPPFSHTWTDAPAGSHTLTARAIDDQGASYLSGPVTITVAAPPGNSPPIVAIVAPTDGVVFPLGEPVTLVAEASDADGSVARVEFYAGDVLLGQATVAPYSLVWAAPPPGPHALVALAVDDEDATTTSPPVHITVSEDQLVAVSLQGGVSGYAGSRDAYLSWFHPEKNFGATVELLDRSDRYAGLLRFAIFQSEGGPVPDGATIQSATLGLYKFSSYADTYRLHRLRRPWNEAEVTWMQSHAGLAWSEPGASGPGTDFELTPDGEATADWTPAWLEIDVTPGVQALSQGAPNHGWKLVPALGTANIKRFHTRETPDATLRPWLRILYAPAETP